MVETERVSQVSACRSRIADLLPIVALLALGLVAYANACRGPFVFDDQQWIPENPDIRYPSRFLPGAPGYLTNPNRAFTHFTFALNYWAGGLDPWGYKAVNVAIHLATALLVYALVRLALSTPRSAGSALSVAPGVVAFTAGAFFVAHPLQTQAVTYTVQRATSLATCLYVLATVLYVRWRLRPSRSATWRILQYCAVVAAVVLAMRSKENGFTAPLAIVAFELCFLEGKASRRIACLAPLLVTLVLVPMTVMDLRGAVADAGATIASASNTTTRSHALYVLTQPAVIARYFSLVFFPVGQSIDHDRTLYRSILEPEVLSGIVLLLVLAGGAAWALLRTRRERSDRIDPGARLIAFGIIWFLLGLSLESLVALDDVMVEHRMYLPSVGLFIAAATLLAFASRRVVPRWPRALAAVAAILGLVLAPATYARNSVWADEVTLWLDAVGKAPRSSRAYTNLAFALVKRGDRTRARTAYAAAIELDPDDYVAQSSYGSMLLDEGQVDMALPHLRTAVELRPDDPLTRFNIAAGLAASGRRDEAIQHYLEAIRLKGYRHPRAENNLAILYVQQRRLDLAVQHFRNAVALDPRDATAHANLGRALASKGDLAAARSEFQAALRLKPNDQAARAALTALSRNAGADPTPPSP